jgi:hypothetical protein
MFLTNDINKVVKTNTIYNFITIFTRQPKKAHFFLDKLYVQVGSYTSVECQL